VSLNLLTTILLEVATSAVFLAQNLQFLILASIHVILVGVFTLAKIVSASTIAPSTSIEKNKLL
jgi:hypothetical protein